MTRKDTGRLDELTKKKINDTETLHKLITECRAVGCHVLTPVQKIDKIAPGHIISLVLVRIDPNNPSMVYRDKRWKADEVALTHVALMQIWVAAGGRWSMSENVPLGEGSNIVRWQVGGSVKEPGGNWIPELDSRTEDYRDGSDTVSGWSPAQLKEARVRIYERAESFAKNRVVRKALGIQQKYSARDLENPFVVVRTSFQADPSHPIDRVALVADSLGATHALYESAAFKGLLERVADNLLLEGGRVPSDPGKALTEAAESRRRREPAEKQQALPEPAPEAPEPITEERTFDDNVLDFNASSKEDQIRTLDDMVKELDFNSKSLTKPIAEFDDYERAKFFVYLLKMKPVENALPWQE
jgi:hypothetical protein